MSVVDDTQILHSSFRPFQDGENREKNIDTQADVSTHEIGSCLKPSTAHTQ